MRVLPVVARNLVQSLHDMLVIDFDGQLAPAVEASGAEIDRADDSAPLVGEQHLGVQLEVLELMDLDADVVKNAYSADTLDQLFLFKGVRRPRHHVDLHAAAGRPHQTLDDDGVLVAFVLDEQCVLCPVYKLGNTVAAVVVTPDEARVLFFRVEFFPMPVGFEAGDNLGDLAAVPVVTA